jgi:SAM-dependent methyltransferase
MSIRTILSKARVLAHRPGGPHLVSDYQSLGYNRVCHLEDFAHPALRGVIRAVFPHDVARFGPEFPAGREYRKHWEVAMAVRTLGDLGVLHDRAQVLGIGAGNEPTIFALTRRVRRVYATDLYLEGGDWRESANTSMLFDPGRHWPSATPWNPRRLVVQHMNALDLAYEDATFDAIFSSSSIEHFGTPDEVRRSVIEMHRVLKPGGVLSISTEFRLAGPPPGLPGILLFDADDVRTIFLGDRPWEPVDSLDFSLSAATLATAIPFAEAAGDVRRHVETHGCLVFHRLDWSRYPHIVLREGDWLWTSIHLALRKPSSK